MSIFDIFQTDEKLERDGRWINYGDDAGRFRIAHINKNGSAYSKLIRARLKPYKRQIETGTADESVLHDIMLKVFAETGILDWEGVCNAEEQEIPYSTDNAVWLLNELPVLYKDLRDIAEDFSNFKQQEREEDAKNSVNA